MIPQEGIDATRRFYQAIDFLKDARAFRGRQTFCDRYGIDRRDFYRIEKRTDIMRPKIKWYTYLVRDYRISARWLLTGKGRMTKKVWPVNKKSRNKRTVRMVL